MSRTRYSAGVSGRSVPRSIHHGGRPVLRQDDARVQPAVQPPEPLVRLEAARFRPPRLEREVARGAAMAQRRSVQASFGQGGAWERRHRERGRVHRAVRPVALPAPAPRRARRRRGQGEGSRVEGRVARMPRGFGRDAADMRRGERVHRRGRSAPRGGRQRRGDGQRGRQRGDPRGVPRPRRHRRRHPKLPGGGRGGRRRARAADVAHAQGRDTRHGRREGWPCERGPEPTDQDGAAQTGRRGGVLGRRRRSGSNCGGVGGPVRTDGVPPRAHRVRLRRERAIGGSVHDAAHARGVQGAPGRREIPPGRAG